MRGERKPKGDEWKQATVGNALKNKHAHTLWCQDCNYHREVPTEFFAVDCKVPLDTPFMTLIERLKCGRCGSRRVGLQVACRKLGGKR